MPMSLVFQGNSIKTGLQTVAILTVDLVVANWSSSTLTAIPCDTDASLLVSIRPIIAVIILDHSTILTHHDMLTVEGVYIHGKARGTGKVRDSLHSLTLTVFVFLRSPCADWPLFAVNLVWEVAPLQVVVIQASKCGVGAAL